MEDKLVISHCLHLPTVQSIYKEERTLNTKNNRKSIAQLKSLVEKEQVLSNKLNYTIHQELVCDQINWGFNSHYNWKANPTAG